MAWAVQTTARTPALLAARKGRLKQRKRQGQGQSGRSRTARTNEPSLRTQM
jgi:hypothetical protein